METDAAVAPGFRFATHDVMLITATGHVTPDHAHRPVLTKYKSVYRRNCHRDKSIVHPTAASFCTAQTSDGFSV